MGESELLMDGRATKDIADIHFFGPIAVELIRGSPQFFVLSFGLIPVFGSRVGRELGPPDGAARSWGLAD